MYYLSYLISISTAANRPEKSLTLTLKKDVMRQSSFNKGLVGSGQGRVAAWVLDTAGFEHCNKGKIVDNLLLKQYKNIYQKF